MKLDSVLVKNRIELEVCHGVVNQEESKNVHCLFVSCGIKISLMGESICRAGMRLYAEKKICRCNRMEERGLTQRETGRHLLLHATESNWWRSLWGEASKPYLMGLTRGLGMPEGGHEGSSWRESILP